MEEGLAEPWEPPPLDRAFVAVWGVPADQNEWEELQRELSAERRQETAPAPHRVAVRVACILIQRTWSEDERKKREKGLTPRTAGYSTAEPDTWTPPLFRPPEPELPETTVWADFLRRDIRIGVPVSDRMGQDDPDD